MKMNSTIIKYNYEFHLEFKQLMKKLDLVLISFPKLLEKLFDNVMLMSAASMLAALCARTCAHDKANLDSRLANATYRQARLAYQQQSVRQRGASQ